MVKNDSNKSEITFIREEASMLTPRVLACQEEMQVSSGFGSSVYPLTDALITDYIPFVKSLIRAYVNDVNKYDTDSLLSIALEAFLLAIRKYSPDSGAFINFATIVIKRRLINDVTKQNERVKRETSISALKTVNKDGDEVSYEIPDERTPWDDSLKWEIEAIKTEAKQYGIEFLKLNKYSPKTVKTKSECFAAVKRLIHNDKLMRTMRRTSLLPLKELCAETGINRKTLERHRQYILVVSLVCTDDYSYLQSWLRLREYGVLP